MHANEPEMAKKWEKKKKKEEENVEEAKKRDYKAEYKKFQSSTKSKKYRAELNKYNRQKGTYGNGDKKDASHKGGKIAGFEEQSKNRGRREKSRLKKEQKLREAIKKIIIEGFGDKFGKMMNSYDTKIVKNALAMAKQVAVSDKRGGSKQTPKLIAIKTINRMKEYRNKVKAPNLKKEFQKAIDKLEKEYKKIKEGKLIEAITGSDRKIMHMIIRDILENFKKAGAKKPSDAVGRGVLSVLRAMTYTPDNANYKNYKKYFSRTFNSKLTQKRLKQFHTQTDKVQLTMVKQAMNKVLGEGKLTEASGVDVAKKVLKNKQHEKGIDMQTANLIVTIHKAYDKNPELQKKFEKIPLNKMKQLILKYYG
jgi:hypothetical protein